MTSKKIIMFDAKSGKFQSTAPSVDTSDSKCGIKSTLTYQALYTMEASKT